MTNSDTPTLAQQGRIIAESGDLRRLRERINLKPAAMATLMGVSPLTYSSWERASESQRRRMWIATAEKIARFHNAATRQLDLLEREGIDLTSLIPYHLAATLLGIPQELLIKWYREDRATATDLGVLGLWMDRAELERLSAR